MECKFCHAEIEENAALCPICGKDLTEEAETVEAEAEVVEATEEAPVEAAEAAEEPEAEVVEAEEEPVESGEQTETETAVAEDEPAAEDSEAAAEDAASEEKPKKSKAGAIIAWILVVLVLLAAAFVGVSWMKRPQEASVAEDSEQNYFKIKETGLNFTAENGDAASVPVATCFKLTDGNNLIRGMLRVLGKVNLEERAKQLGLSPKGAQLTNGMLSLYYWDAFYNTYNQYSYYLSLMGLDPAAMESSQVVEGDGQTWQEYFLSMALDSFLYQTAIYETALEEGFVLPQEQAEEIAAMRKELSGMPGVEEQLVTVYGEGVTVEDYLTYVEMNYYYSAYMMEYESSLNITDDEIQEYFKNHQEEFESAGMNMTDKPNVNVRHILIRPDDPTNEADWGEANKKAVEILDQWLAGAKTEDSFSELAKEYSQDGNAAAGGLYEDVFPGQMVSTFNDWCFDDSRKSGDCDIVQTEYGFHVIYFVGASETYQWMEDVRSKMIDEKIMEYYNTLRGNYSMTYDLAKIAIPLPGQIQPSAQSGQDSTTATGVDGMEQSVEEISKEQLMKEAAAEAAYNEQKTVAPDITDATDAEEPTEITPDGTENVGGIENASDGNEPIAEEPAAE